ncbi:MAG: YtxH domain-containing protein [Gemmatimonadales bacterium]
MSDRDDRPVIIIEKGGLGSFFVGLLAGAAAALLLAPQAGEDTRRKLRDKGLRIREAASETWDELQDNIGSKYDEARSRVEDGLDTAKRTFRDSKEAGTAAVHTAREELERRLADARAARKEEEEPTETAVEAE